MHTEDCMLNKDINPWYTNNVCVLKILHTSVTAGTQQAEPWIVNHDTTWDNYPTLGLLHEPVRSEHVSAHSSHHACIREYLYLMTILWLDALAKRRSRDRSL